MKKGNKKNYLAVILLLLSSGTIIFYYELSPWMCFLIFFYGIYMLLKSSESISRVFSLTTTKFAVVFTFWIWINYLFINTNHYDRSNNVIIYTLLLWGAVFITSTINYVEFKAILLNVLSKICLLSIVIFVGHILHVVPSWHLVGKHFGDFDMVLFDRVMEGRLSSIWWEPSAFAVVLSLTLLLHLPDIIKKNLSKKEWIRVGILVVSMVLTNSVSGYFSIALMAMSVMLYSIKKARNIAAIPLILIAGIGMVYIIFTSDAVTEKLSQDYGSEQRTGSLNIRLSDNMAMLQMSGERPLTGYGIDSYDYEKRSLALNNWSSSNGVLNMAAMLGIPIVLLYYLFACNSLKRKNIFINKYLAATIFIFINCFNGMIMYPIVWAAFLDYKKVDYGKTL